MISKRIPDYCLETGYDRFIKNPEAIQNRFHKGLSFLRDLHFTFFQLKELLQISKESVKYELRMPVEVVTLNLFLNINLIDPASKIYFSTFSHECDVTEVSDKARLYEFCTYVNNIRDPSSVACHQDSESSSLN
jgi:hypothetical protein